MLARQATPESFDVRGDGESNLFREAAVLTWNQLVNVLEWLVGLSANLLWAGLIVVAFIWGSGRLRRRLRTLLEARTKGRNNLPALIDNMLQIVVYILAALFAFSALGADSSAFVQAFGLITAAISLSLQDVLKNFVAGIYLLAEEPFSAGDRLEISGQVGIVERITVRTTVLRNDKEQQVLVPNYQVFSQVVSNRTAYQYQTLSIQLTGVKEDFDTALAGHEEWLAGVPGLPPTPPTVLLTKIAPDDCELTVTAWVPRGDDPRNEIVKRLRDRFPDATLTITA
jgi:small-conductance mechanosensitive channel